MTSIRINSGFLRFCLSFCMVAALFFGIASTAFADSIAGILRIDDQAQLHIVMGAQKTDYKLEASGPVLLDLRRLKSGDFVAGQGIIDDSDKSIALESINSIGLQQLLGTWRSANWEVFEFTDFSSLNLYVPKMQKDGIRFSKTHTLSYVVTPAENNAFSIFLTDNAMVRMAFIAIEKNRLNMSITDFETGRVTQTFSLSPFALQ